MKMKVQCDVCEIAEATLMCIADEAALCSQCDDKVHAANKLASKHQRVPLISPSHLPKCDICQEKNAYFFCVEDRALLCRQCDVSIHSANHLVAAHQRLLVTGIKVGLDPIKNISGEKAATGLKEVSASAMNKGPGTVLKGPGTMHKGPGTRPGAAIVSDYISESLPGWRMDEAFLLPYIDNGYGFDEPGSSKADNGNFGEYEWSTSPSGAKESNVEEYIAQVPEMPSPPTASGLYWPHRLIPPTQGKNNQVFGFCEFYNPPLVPDIGCQSSPPDSPLSKRRKLVA
ncbi:hypothetical protein SUGI_0274330 [Cryptomeria japonica]|uniref:B-box zinc finger protein 22 n=1 Tax=Cryptomeria japonica TaxID=3369 RepID=UPI002408D910|nr:B-box zinc finger protein 22 [Cryptomeria japonica]GLJ16284.1 hypothetical protein SUGI_0274330 [Cryptomeria japonica]